MRRQAPEDLAGHPGYNNVGRVNPDGSVACSAIAAPAGYSMADADFFRQALATKALASLFWFELELPDAGLEASGSPLVPVSLAAAGRR